MSWPASVAAYTVRDALEALERLVLRHQEAAEGTDLFLVLNELHRDTQSFIDRPAFKALQRAAMVEAGQMPPADDTRPAPGAEAVR